jgi:hypothetical protein
LFPLLLAAGADLDNNVQVRFRAIFTDPAVRLRPRSFFCIASEDYPARIEHGPKSTLLMPTVMALYLLMTIRRRENCLTAVLPVWK